MKQTLLVMMVAVTAFCTSCSKTTDEINVSSKLIGKWILKTSVSKYFNGVQNSSSTHNFEANEYILFEGNNTYTIRVDNEINQSTWKLLDDNKVLYMAPAGAVDLAEDGYEIQTLTDHNLVLYNKDKSSASGYEVTIYLER